MQLQLKNLITRFCTSGKKKTSYNNQIHEGRIESQFAPVRVREKQIYLNNNKK